MSPLRLELEIVVGVDGVQLQFVTGPSSTGGDNFIVKLVQVSNLLDFKRTSLLRYSSAVTSTFINAVFGLPNPCGRSS